MRWNMDIIKSSDGYRGIISFEYAPTVNIDYCKTWREFYEKTRETTGICIPKRKYFTFHKLSDFEQLSGIDASHVRKSCVVTKGDRLSGWKRDNF